MKSTLIIGVGSIGERHLRCFLATQRTRVSFCEPNAELRQTIAERYSVEGFDSVTNALTDRSFDCAVICTPAHTHIPIAHQLLDRRIALLMEKPLSVSYEGVPALLERIDREQHIIRVAYIYRSFPIIHTLRQILQEKQLGEPKQLNIVSGQNFPFFRPAYKSIYYNNHATGGGAIQDALTHPLNTVEWLFGPIQQVYCDAEHQVLEGVNVEDTVNMVARNQHGLLISFSMNQFQAPNESHWFIHCDKGSLKMETHNQRLGIMKHGDSDWQWTVLPKEERDSGFIRQANSFLDAVEGKESYLSTITEAAQTLRVQLAALESARTGQRISDLAKP